MIIASLLLFVLPLLGLVNAVVSPLRNYIWQCDETFCLKNQTPLINVDNGEMQGYFEVLGWEK